VVCGVCWATTTNPTIENNKITHNQYLGSFECNLTGLLTNTTYYVRAFATNSAGTAYGKSIAFTTLIIPPIIFNPSITYGSMTDQEGNIYKTVTIGTQTWMAENLHTTKYNNGTAIPNVTVDSIWSSHTSPAYCWYNNDAGYKVIYGALYNWYTVKTGKLCPSGWHVSTDAEWTTLTTYLGGESVAGDKLKEIGTTHWSSTFEGNEGATNESGFTALPGDMRDSYFNGTHGGIGYWWSSSIEGNYRQIWWDDSHIMSKEYMDYAGMSVRCLRDN
jgi:uncharacterized protein (TIGR02145 family)